MEKKLKCTSCKKELINDRGSTVFTCPTCNKTQIVRCSQCRKLGTKYQCPTCETEGPN
ncbi:RNA-binding protein [archaeon]|jgi:Zn-ribbon RNA-binding protein|nr:RNA-binding protein [archaeon]MBT4396964.1 RNA-binding protein [archaeon]MBT4440955.1 RNA-binding protein [archaeon]